eukprot:scaffold388480_cov19-Prasinocladus_malaysianus.AAC.2
MTAPSGLATSAIVFGKFRGGLYDSRLLICSYIPFWLRMPVNAIVHYRSTRTSTGAEATVKLAMLLFRAAT